MIIEEARVLVFSAHAADFCSRAGAPLCDTWKPVPLCRSTI